VFVMLVCDLITGILLHACLNLSCASLSFINVLGLRCFFGFKRSDSVSQILLELGLPSFNTLLYSSRIIFRRTGCKCPNTGVT